MRLILVRHGEAHAGFTGVIAGPTGCLGLTERGREQAEALRDRLATSDRLRADHLVVSILPRAVETATIIAPAFGLEIASRECGLCELHPGEADGLAWAEYAVRYGSFGMEAEPDRVFAPGGESWNDFHERVRTMLGRLAADHAAATVVAVCHAGVITASMRVLLGVAGGAGGAELRPSNTGLTEWEHEPSQDRWTLRYFNDASHLDGLTGESGSTRFVSDDSEFSVDAARTAAERDTLAAWVSRFLASPGSDNAVLAEELPNRFRWWCGPVRVRLDRLRRLAGPPDAPVLCPVDDDFWRSDVDEIAERVERGWEPPPVIVSFAGDHMVLEDGNHRVEGLRRSGRQEVWAVIGFDDPDERDAFDG